jgi:NAD(P)-dependent dehydrogenase (short-subunit alcohol dehydrogenase family)
MQARQLVRPSAARAAGRNAAGVCCLGGLSGSFNGVDNLVALVTGANKGIGKEIARQLADAGLIVYVGSRDAARGERAVAEMGGDTRLLVVDVTDDASIADAARQTGTLDILVNNAGISGDDKSPDQEDAGTFRRIYQTNVFGVVAVTNAFVPALRRSAHPRIVNISSSTGSLTLAGGRAAGGFAAYRSSKAALNALTIFYAHTLAADGFKVNALAPGLRRTGLNAVAAARGGDPAEAAAGAVYLALLPDDGPTGQFLSWDGTHVPW